MIVMFHAGDAKERTVLSDPCVKRKPKPIFYDQKKIYNQ